MKTETKIEDKTVPNKKEPEKMETPPNVYDKVVIGIVELLIRFGFIIVLALPFSWIWNAILPELFCFPHISYFQSMGLMILGELLFTTKVEFY